MGNDSNPAGWPDPLVEWAATSTVGVEDPARWFTQLAERMTEAGLPLARFRMHYDILHPQYAGMSTTWRRGGADAEVTCQDHGLSERPAYKASPVRLLDEGRVPEIRRCLDGPAAELDFPVLEDLKAEGMTGYFALPLRLSNGRPGVASYATDRAGGFSDDDVARLRQVTRAAARGFEIVIRHETSRSLARAYLGPRTGDNVLAGGVRRGDGETIDAVIWFSDLRRSTALSEAMPLGDFLALLNRYFDCLAGAVEERGGEVLRFIGDAVLAIFPVETPGDAGWADACARAADAARQAEENIRRLNAERAAQGREPIGYGIGLHLGPVHYGNIGTAGRVEFTVVGAAANETAKIETRCKDLGETVLVSDAVAGHLEAPTRDLGELDIPGLARKMRLFALA